MRTAVTIGFVVAWATSVLAGCQTNASESGLAKLKGNFVTVSIRKDIQGASEVTPAQGSVQSSDRVRDVFGELVEVSDRFLVVRVNAAPNKEAHTTVIPWASVVAVEALDAPAPH